MAVGQSGVVICQWELFSRDPCLSMTCSEVLIGGRAALRARPAARANPDRYPSRAARARSLLHRPLSPLPLPSPLSPPLHTSPTLIPFSSFA